MGQVFEELLRGVGCLAFLGIEVLSLFAFHGIDAVGLLSCNARALALGRAKWVFVAFLVGLLVQNSINELFLVAVVLRIEVKLMRNIFELGDTFS